MTRQSKTMLQAVENIKRKAGVGESGRGVEERLEENMMKSGTLEQQNYAFFFFLHSRLQGIWQNMGSTEE